MPDINAAYSALSSISQKISLNSVVGSITSGVSVFASAAKSALGIPSLKVSTQFAPKDFAKPPVAGNPTSPTQAKIDTPKFAGAFTFPTDMQYYTMFSFKEYKKKDVTSVAKDSSSVVIILPLPANLTESFAVTYDTPMLGPVVGAAAEGIINAVRQNDVLGAMGAAGKNIVSAGEAGVLSGLKKMGGAGEMASQIGSMALGVAPNPHLAVIFSNIGLRSHKFSYKFAPRSEAELKILKTIITNLKHKMLPGLDKNGGMLFSFPDVVDIKFVTGRGQAPYVIKRCVMESLDINYAPGGSPAFFKTGDPVMVEISMSFKEMSPFTRDDILGSPDANARAARAAVAAPAPAPQQK